MEENEIERESLNLSFKLKKLNEINKKTLFIFINNTIKKHF